MEQNYFYVYWSSSVAIIVVGGIKVLEHKYNYCELLNEYNRISDFIELKPPKYREEIKNDFSIEKEQPINWCEIGILIEHFKRELEFQNDTTKLDLYRRELKLFDNFLDMRVDYFKDLGEVKFPFGLRDFVTLEIPQSKSADWSITSYYDYVVRVKKHTIEHAKKNNKMPDGLEEKHYFTANFVGKKEETGWVNPLVYTYKSVTGRKYEPENNIDDDALMEALTKVLFASMKMSYSGLIKELYTKMIILTHPKVCSGEIGFYRTNSIGDGLGIDFMLKNANGIWGTVAVTNFKKTNKICDLRFMYGKKTSDCHELLPNSWIYVPKDYYSVYNKIEEFSHEKTMKL